MLCYANVARTVQGLQTNISGILIIANLRDDLKSHVVLILIFQGLIPVFLIQNWMLN